MLKKKQLRCEYWLLLLLSPQFLHGELYYIFHLHENDHSRELATTPTLHRSDRKHICAVPPQHLCVSRQAIMNESQLILANCNLSRREILMVLTRIVQSFGEQKIYFSDWLMISSCCLFDDGAIIEDSKATT